MSNTTGPSIPIVPDAWAGYLAQAKDLPTSRLALLALVNIPVLAIVLNVLWQLVRVLEVFNFSYRLNIEQLIPRRKSDPPLVFHWIPIIGSAIEYGNNPLKFFLTCREKVCLYVYSISSFAQGAIVWRCLHVHSSRSSRDSCSWTQRQQLRLGWKIDCLWCRRGLHGESGQRIQPLYL